MILQMYLSSLTILHRDDSVLVGRLKKMSSRTSIEEEEEARRLADQLGNGKPLGTLLGSKDVSI